MPESIFSEFAKKVVIAVAAAAATAWLTSQWISLKQLWTDIDEMRTEFRTEKDKLEKVERKQDYVLGQYDVPDIMLSFPKPEEKKDGP